MGRSVKDPDTQIRKTTAQSCAALPTVDVHGVAISAISESQCVAHILRQMDAGHGGWVVTANLDHLRRLVCDREYRRLCDQANIIVADGMPLIWASRIRGTPLPQRVAGSSLIWSLSDAAAARGRSLFLLGGSPGTADSAARVLGRCLPSLQIAGTYCPPVDFDRNEAHVTRLGQMISAA
ncbi:MAG: WecB/TagA/CpsF family glycosyltransferase, partial [Pirellulaceae bacterium]|nr:WecB/TagA/CpsF family glycosyltransferase [Pirellulaceae bacterium]